MRNLALLLLLATPLHAQLWGKLEPGPYASGFTQLDRYDISRPYRTARTIDGKPREGERARPIRISIWYPAQASNAKTLTMGDYLDMLASEARFREVTADEKRAAENAFFGNPLLNTLTPEHRAKMRTLTTRAVRDAKPVDGKFPVVLYSLGATAIANITPEYLASHGYVVALTPRLGAFAGLPQDNRDALDLETKLRDMDFMLNAIRDWKQADTTNMAALGFSAGGRWALAAAMKSPDVRAVVSLDSVMLFNDRVTEAWKTMPHYNLDSVRVPVLHMVRSAFAAQEDMKMWEAMRYADRTYVLFEDPALDHWDFQSLGYATALAGARGASASKVDALFHRFNRTTLAFLDAHLKGGAAFQAEGAKHIAAQPAPLSNREFMNALVEDDVDTAIAANKRAPIDEAAMNVAGYTLLFSGRTQDALKVLAANAEAYPNSSNVYDSLADAYLATGDRAKALELTKKAAEVLEKEQGLTPERRAAIKGSVEQKLKELK